MESVVVSPVVLGLSSATRLAGNLSVKSRSPLVCLEIYANDSAIHHKLQFVRLSDSWMFIL